MARGPKPKPGALRLLQGGKSPDQENLEPAVARPTELPGAPDILWGFGAEEWDRVMPELYATGIYADIDESMLVAYCMEYHRWRQATEDLKAQAKVDPNFHGAVIKTTNGNLVNNPLVGIASTALKNMHRIAAEFGMTPSARARLAGTQKETDPLAGKYGL